MLARKKERQALSRAMTVSGARAYVPRSLGLAPSSTRGFFPAGPGNHEKKFFDIATTGYQVNTTGSFTLLFIPVVGADYNARVGRKCQVKSIFIRGRIELENVQNLGLGTASYGQQHRCIIFIDAQPNGVAPAVTDLLNEALPSSQLNANNRDRFIVLKDKNYYFDPFLYSTTATQAIVMMGKTGFQLKYYKKTNSQVIFNSTNGGTIADITSGAIYMFWIGSAVAGANTDGTAVVSTRVRYDDV